MSDIIRLLPESVSSQIAAGEVVQRPASVVKEMVENAVDAGATSIQVMLSDAGRTSIRIIDNGCGMSETDARTAFLRHATSKIHVSEDLFSLSTFGFRGEALASIAAVAQVELCTRREEDEVGTKVCAAGADIVSQEPVACPKGCSFTVKNLFYNVPARRKFLKSNQAEMSHIMTEIQRVALIHPEIAFEVYSQGDKVLDLPESPLKQRIMNLFGKRFDKMLLPVQVDTSIVRVNGFVGTLDSVRRKCSEQFFFVNGRFMRHPYFHKAVLEPYENLVPEGEQPPYFIFLEVPAESIDVNIHPAKTEIKFAEEQPVWKIINAVVREAVGRFESMPSIDFDTEDMPDIPVYDASTREVHQPTVRVDSSFNPFKSTPQRSGGGDWTALFGDILEKKSEKESSLEEPFAGYASQSPAQLLSEVTREAERMCFQIDNRFIVASDSRGLLVVDQRRAHIRVLYDQYVDQMQSHAVPSQGLLFPEMFQLSAADAALLPDFMEDIAALGFDISDMGRGAVAVHGVPSGLEGVDYEKLIVELIHVDGDASVAESELAKTKREQMALRIARSAAIREGQKLSEDEMKRLISDLMASSVPARTPDGKSIMVLRTSSDLSRLLS
ncbi:MAG: DNA mismatch repair endonuclease MutL [Bacteroidaceae bacterium]|nr:DNA mismatch repair endonuclease MutL [Bacteroidaceae bacterium]